MDFNLADIGEGIAEVEIMQWFVKPGDPIMQFDRVCEVQSDKATVEITSRYDGVIDKLCYDIGDMAAVGQPLITIKMEAGAGEPESADIKGAPPSTASSDTASTSSSPPKKKVKIDASKVLTSPAVRRIAKEESIDLTEVVGTGPKGRLLKEDVLNYVEARNNGTLPSSNAKEASINAPVQNTAGSSSPTQHEAVFEDRTIKIKGLQRIMVKTMEAANMIPTFGYCDEIEMNALVEVRRQLKETCVKQDINLSTMPFFLKAASLALLEYPQLNAHVTCEHCTEVTYKGSHNIGVAMDTPRGLLVPNIKNVQHKTIKELAMELNRLQKLGSEGKLGPADLSGGTFTLSNIGAIGGTYASPIIVMPEVVIGALGKFQTVPRYNDKMEVRPCTIMSVSWAADHRVVDGATMARFSNVWKTYIENPNTMLLDL